MRGGDTCCRISAHANGRPAVPVCHVVSRALNRVFTMVRSAILLIRKRDDEVSSGIAVPYPERSGTGGRGTGTGWLESAVSGVRPARRHGQIAVSPPNRKHMVAVFCNDSARSTTQGEALPESGAGLFHAQGMAGTGGAA